MNKQQIIFLLLALFTTFSMIGVGVSIALKSLILFLLSSLTAAICCGIGFTIRKQNNVQ